MSIVNTNPNNNMGSGDNAMMRGTINPNNNVLVGGGRGAMPTNMSSHPSVGSQGLIGLQGSQGAPPQIMGMQQGGANQIMGTSNQPPTASLMALSQKLTSLTEQTWMVIGNVSNLMNDSERALHAYEYTLRHNPYSVTALVQLGNFYRQKESFAKAIELYQRALNVETQHGEVWGYLGYCYLMTDDLQKAYSAYQQALYQMSNHREPHLWYGIGMLYDRYGSDDHAEEAFTAVLKMDPKFTKSNEIYYRLGLIYRHQQKFDTSLECFRYILSDVPKSMTELDIWLQIGLVYECQRNFDAAKGVYERILSEKPRHIKTLMQLGWLYHYPQTSFSNADTAVQYLNKSLEDDQNNAQCWYFLGRVLMEQQKYNRAYESFQQAVYRDGRNPLFWCSIGILYYKISQFRDALDAYSRAIHLNPYISTVWLNLGVLYESCNNQINDALDAYQRALEIDPNISKIKSRLQYLRQLQISGGQMPPGANGMSIPTPEDLDPITFRSPVAGSKPLPRRPSSEVRQPVAPQPVPQPAQSLFDLKRPQHPAQPHMPPHRLSSSKSPFEAADLLATLSHRATAEAVAINQQQQNRSNVVSRQQEQQEHYMGPKITPINVTEVHVAAAEALISATQILPRSEPPKKATNGSLSPSASVNVSEPLSETAPVKIEEDAEEPEDPKKHIELDQSDYDSPDAEKSAESGKNSPLTDDDDALELDDKK